MIRPRHNPTLFAVVCLAVISHTSFNASRMTVSLAALQLKAPTVQVGMLLSLYALLPMLLSVPCGRWIDRVGTRLPMIGGASMLALACALPVAFPVMAALYANSLLAGVGFLLFHLCTQKLTGELGDGAERMHNFGMLAVGMSVSGFFGPIIAGFLIDHGGPGASFTAAFAGSTVLIVVAIALLKWRWTFTGRSLVAPPSRGDGARIMDLLATPQLRRLYVAVVLIAMCWDVLAFMFPVQGTRIGLSASQIGLVLGAFSAATFIVRIALPLIVRRFSEWQLICVVQTVAAAVYLVLPLLIDQWALMALSFTLGLGMGVGQPAVMTIMHRASPPGRVGEAAGLRMTLINASQTTLPTAFGAAGSVLATFVGGALAFAPLFWTVALTAGVGAVMTFRWSREERAERDGPMEGAGGAGGAVSAVGTDGQDGKDGGV